MEAALEEIASVIAKHKTAPANESGITPQSSKPDVPILAKKSFASILSTTIDLPTHPSQLLPPRYRGDQVVIKIDQEEYNKPMGLSKSNLIGRLMLKKGFEPIKVDDLKAGLNRLWKPQQSWDLFPMPRGFYVLHFSDPMDMQRIWGSGTCTLTSGYFRLYQWQSDFDPYTIEIHSLAHIWVKIYGLSWEYWCPNIIMGIARGVGMPLQLDKITREGIYGYYARVLMEVDVLDTLSQFLNVERGDYEFQVKLVYENLPSKCSSCRAIGHDVAKCRVFVDDNNTRGRSRSRKPLHGLQAGRLEKPRSYY
ncbi:DUF4283 domain protein [Melia azedarach]|uniref:DUF4283 domain protein n=1 Tax=Melia azedarach TaxID=155640 RepID=A0ACC1XMP2_MELAZ|nr:DUF4283 domain protein [Melia azedarach]